MHVLVLSLRSEHCVNLLEFIKNHEALMSVMKFHDVNKFGVPNGVDRVPTLICPDGQIMVGSDIKEYLNGFIQSEPEAVTSGHGFDIDGNEPDGFFDVNQYGVSLAPKMTPELEKKISMSVQDAFASLKT